VAVRNPASHAMPGGKRKHQAIEVMHVAVNDIIWAVAAQGSLEIPAQPPGVSALRALHDMAAQAQRFLLKHAPTLVQNHEIQLIAVTIDPPQHLHQPQIDAAALETAHDMKDAPRLS
jgi:hypothetical protein